MERGDDDNEDASRATASPSTASGKEDKSDANSFVAAISSDECTTAAATLLPSWLQARGCQTNAGAAVTAVRNQTTPQK